MKLIEMISAHEVFPTLQELFPKMIETAADVDVVNWRTAYEIADKNPEIIEEIEFYEYLRNNELITAAECQRKINELTTGVGCVSRTEGIAFTETRQVAFRSPRPHINIILHELGHVHFQEPDTIWSATYGGGEILMHIGLFRGFETGDDEILLYHAMRHNAYEMPSRLAKEVAQDIVAHTKIDCYPNIGAIALYSGLLLEGVVEQLRDLGHEDIYNELTDARWEKIIVTSDMMLDFLNNTIKGVLWKDTVSCAFARALGLIRTPFQKN